MLTQTIVVNLTQSKLSAIIMRSEEKGREIRFEVIDEAGEAVDITDYAVKFIMLKPDENIVMADAAGGVVTQTEQMTTAKGAGYYCIRLIDDDTVVYSGQGKVLIDDHVVDDETLNSISEVDGLIFPDDFITVDDHVAVIDDDTTSTESTWSSDKISDEISDISVDVSKTATGNPIEITDGASAPLVKCVTEIQGYQEGTGTPSPDNVRPIHAYTENTVSVGNKTLGGVNFMRPGIQKREVVNGLTFISDGKGRYSIKGTATDNTTLSVDCDEYVVPDGNAPHSFGLMNNNGAQAEFHFYYNNTNITYWNMTPANRVVSYSQMSNQRCNKYVIVINSGAVIDVEFSPMICPGYTSAFPPTFATCYVYSDHTTSYPSAIYRGSEDVVNGEVTGDWLKAVFDGSDDESWGDKSSATYCRFAIIIPDCKIPESGRKFVICNEGYSYSSGHDIGTIFISSDSKVYFYPPLPLGSTVSDFKTWLAINNLEIAYELATPTTSSVTPTNLPIKSLSGYNHIESSTGEMEIEYITEKYQPLIDSIKQLF